MFIYSAFTDKVIDFSHFDEMMIGYFDREGHKCGFKEADFFEVRVAKLVNGSWAIAAEEKKVASNAQKAAAGTKKSSTKKSSRKAA